MDVGAACAVMQIDGDGIPYLHAQEWSRHPVIEGPVFIDALVRELSFDFGRFEIEGQML